MSKSSMFSSENMQHTAYDLKAFMAMLKINTVEDLLTLGPCTNINFVHVSLLFTVYTRISNEDSWPTCEDGWQKLGFESASEVYSSLNTQIGSLTLLLILFYLNRHKNIPCLLPSNIPDIKKIFEISEMLYKSIQSKKITSIPELFHIFCILCDISSSDSSPPLEEALKNIRIVQRDYLIEKIKKI